MRERLFGILVGLALVLGMSLTAYADNTTFDTLVSNDTTVTIKGVSNVEWYVIGHDGTANTVTLLSKQFFNKRAFKESGAGNSYETSDIKNYVEGLTGEGQPLAGIKDVLANVSVTDPAVTGAVPYLLNIAEAGQLSECKRKAEDLWWLRSPGGDGNSAALVYGSSGNIDHYGGLVHGTLGVRPALNLNLSDVNFSSVNLSDVENATIGGGSAR